MLTNKHGQIIDIETYFSDVAFEAWSSLLFTRLGKPAIKSTIKSVFGFQNVWIPKWKVVMTGDNIYEAFPNLYAVRGTPPRNCEDWYQSLDKVRRLKLHHLVPSHTEPISGKKKVSSIIKHYRDAIQFINDQTTQNLNSGYSVDEIAKIVRLPTVLSSHPYLQEHYGMTVWSVRCVIEGKTGWFDRDVIFFSVEKATNLPRTYC